MMYGIYRIDQILKCSNLLFGNPNVNVEDLKMLNNYDLRYDYAEMYRMLSEIREIIDNIIQKEDENINIGKLMADQDQEGDKNNELQRSTGTEI